MIKAVDSSLGIEFLQLTVYKEVMRTFASLLSFLSDFKIQRSHGKTEYSYPCSFMVVTFQNPLKVFLVSPQSRNLAMQ